LNGGASWIDKTTGAISGGFVNGIDFVNSTGFVYAGSQIFKTTNNGSSWRDITSNKPSSASFSIYMLNENTWFMGSYVSTPTLYKSINAGGSWTAIPKGASITISRFHFASSSVGFALNGVPVIGAAAVVTRTLDGGNSWTDITAPAMNYSYTYNGISVNTSGVGYVVGSDHIYKTTNNGTAWTAPVTHPSTSTMYLYNIKCFNTNNNVIAIGNSPDGTIGRIARSTDGGSSWTITDFPGVSIAGGTTETSLQFAPDGLHGVVGLSNGDVLYTINNGISWTRTSTTLTAGARYIAAKKTPL
jgi:photosystem II stability/assembly factor-like uncharacterized protein